MDRVKAGTPAIDLVKLCYAARRPVLFSGRHGVGKSEILEHAAAEMGIGFISRDLSLMEPPDLIGLPKVSGKTTTYLPPSFLPTSGSGLLIFEELNRCERFMRAPCLQLLTSRSLNDYRLPEAWLPLAAINPSDGEYEVAELDPALSSRFVRVHLVPDQKEWLDWALRANVHPAVIEYVESDLSVFDKAQSNPRAWTYVSDLLKAAEKQGASESTLRATILGLVGDTRGAAFFRSIKSEACPLSAEGVLESYGKHRRKVRRWIDQGRLDLAESSVMNVLKFLQPQREYEDVRGQASHWRNLGRFLADLPGDLRGTAEVFFKERGYTFPRHRTAGSK